MLFLGKGILTFVMAFIFLQSGFAQQPQNWTSDNAYPTNSNYQEQQALLGLHRGAQALWEAVHHTQRSYPDSVQIIGQELNANPAPWYKDYLYRLLVEQKQEFDQQGYETPVRKIVFSRWPQTFSTAAQNLAAQFQNSTSQEALSDLAYKVHVFYFRSLAASYIFIESLIRQYLPPNQQQTLNSNQRTDLLNRINSIHTRSQLCIQWMHHLRHNQNYAVLWTSEHFRKSKCWECSVGIFFHYRINKENGFPLNTDHNFGRYLAPFVPEYIQAQLLTSIFRDRENFPSSNHPQENVPQKNNDPNPPSKENDSDTNKAQEQLELQLQYLLQTPEVQKNQTLKESIQKFLQELRPGLPPRKPLPPPSSEENKDEENKSEDGKVT